MKISILRFPSSNVLSAYFFALLSLLYFALRSIRLKAMRAVGMRGGCSSPFASYHGATILQNFLDLTKKMILNIIVM